MRSLSTRLAVPLLFAQVVNDFVDSILAVDPDANVVVLRDLNDFEFSQTMQILEGSPEVLHDLISTLPRIKITALGTRGPESSGKYVVFDGFREP